VADGPFVETEEGARRLLCPARFGGVEVRPVMAFD
jgi:hypothetical protein